MTTQGIENIIQGYISELHNTGIEQFHYTGSVLYLFRDSLTDEQYRYVDFITELIIVKSMVKHGDDRYDIKRHIDIIADDYSDDIVQFYPLSCAVDSLIMQYENG